MNTIWSCCGFEEMLAEKLTVTLISFGFSVEIYITRVFDSLLLMTCNIKHYGHNLPVSSRVYHQIRRGLVTFIDRHGHIEVWNRIAFASKESDHVHFVHHQFKRAYKKRTVFTNFLHIIE